MAKRISDIERVTAYFQTASEDAANVMVQVIKGIMASRFKKEVKKRGPNKAKGSQAPTLLTNQGAAQSNALES